MSRVLALLFALLLPGVAAAQFGNGPMVGVGGGGCALTGCTFTGTVTGPDSGTWSSTGISATFVTTSTTTNITAAGTNQGTATALTAQQNIVTSTPSGTGVILPYQQFVPFFIANEGTNLLSVYPPSGAQINTYGTNAAAGVAANGSATIRCVSSTQCYAN